MQILVRETVFLFVRETPNLRWGGQNVQILYMRIRKLKKKLFSLGLRLQPCHSCDIPINIFLSTNKHENQNHLKESEIQESCSSGTQMVTENIRLKIDENILVSLRASYLCEYVIRFGP